MSSNFKQPVLIKAGSHNLHLGSGVLQRPPAFDCRVVSEANYQTLKEEIQKAIMFLEDGHPHLCRNMLLGITSAM